MKSSLKEFWDIINRDYPKLVNMIVDYNEDEITLKEDNSFLSPKDLSPIYSLPPVLPIERFTTTFNQEEVAFYIKLKLK